MQAPIPYYSLVETRCIASLLYASRGYYCCYRLYELNLIREMDSIRFAVWCVYFPNLTAHFYLAYMSESDRIYSIDIMRGLTLILMLFVNDLDMPGVPAWLGHRAADFDGMGRADWVFPGLLLRGGRDVRFATGTRK